MSAGERDGVGLDHVVLAKARGRARALRAREEAHAERVPQVPEWSTGAAAGPRRRRPAGGPSYVEGTPEARIISNGIDAGIEAQGNGLNALMRVKGQVAEIRRTLPK